MIVNKCRFCGSPLHQTFANLGLSPLANSYVSTERASAAEAFYPLHAFVCSDCRLVQAQDVQTSEHIFSDYLYFSSFSDSWLAHCKAYAAQMVERFKFGPNHQVVEIASNDGYLLQYFKERGIAILGVEPAANVAKVAIDKGIPTDVSFFGVGTAERLVAEGKAADLIAANNVVAHVPDLNDFIGGMKRLLKPSGVITLEFPHLMRMIRENQFDTIYHEHFSYFSFIVMERILKHHGLTVFDVDQLPTHGGSLRVYARHAENSALPIAPAVGELRQAELDMGLDQGEIYDQFARQVIETKFALLEFLIKAKREGKTVVGYGAPAKGNTLLNYCGVQTDMIDFTVDRSPHKQNMLLPGTHIPIKSPEAIIAAKPDYVLILPWNLKDEIVDQMKEVRSWGGQFVVPIPVVQIIP